MKQSLDDIAALAEDLGCRYFSEGKVNLEKIAKSKGIRFIEGNYDDHFLGQLVHLSKKFYIILNLDLLFKSESGRIRFTIAHELGHYFIDGHRTKLAKGISLSFKGELNESEIKEIEIAANHFAAHLLMPKSLFIKHTKRLEPGISAIMKLKTKFDTSIESTVKHYIKLDISASIMIKWRTDLTFHYAWCSDSFSTLTGINKYRLPIRFDSKYIKDQIDDIKKDNLDYIDAATPISRWINTVLPGTIKDILGLEQIIKLGDYGGITFLTFYK